jgi:hypothetical protein
MFIERRAHPRYKVNIPVKFTLVEDKADTEALLEESKKELAAQTRNLSLGGIKIDSDQPIQEGSVLIFEISLPGVSQPVLVSGEVVWVEGNTSGLHFLEISDEDFDALRAYLNKLEFRS